MKLEIDGVTKRFGDHVVLRDVQLKLEKVHTLALIGPSGGGKSTLLRIIAGLEPADSGAVVLDGNALATDERALHEYRRTVGTVFQAFNLFPHLSAVENIVLPLVRVHGYGRKEAQDVAMEHLSRFRLGDHADKKPALLSGGQRQRVAIARAIAIKPRLLLFDEPTSALDPEMTAEVLDMIRELRDEGRDFLLVTHEMGFARVVSDFVALLVGGEIAECGAPEQVFEAPQTSAARDFLGRVLRY